MGEKTVFVLNGGFSTQLSKYSTDYETHPLWTSYLLYKNCETVYQTHLDYLSAGADIISTNTYQASIPGFKTYLDAKLTEQECIDIMKKAVRLAKDARSCIQSESNGKRDILIAGSVGSYGAYLHDGSEYTGSYAKTTSIDEIREWHKPRIETLVQEGVDLLAFETIPVSVEAEMLAELLKSYPNMKAWISFCCKDGTYTNSGEHFQTVAKKCYDINPDQIIAVGVNCSKPEYIEHLFQDFNIGREYAPIPLIVYPNSGETFDTEKGWINKEQCKPLESYVKTWIDIGVKYIGGCCRTNSETIKRIRKEVDTIQDQHVKEFIPN